jgi:hypothetical protein
MVATVGEVEVAGRVHGEALRRREARLQRWSAIADVAGRPDPAILSIDPSASVARNTECEPRSET